MLLALELHDRLGTTYNVCQVTGQTSWIANTNRPDVAYNAMKLAMMTRNSTLQDLKFVNETVRKVHSRPSVLVFKKIGKLEDLVIHGFSDASYKFGEKAVGGTYVMLGKKNSDRVLSLNWKSKLMRKVTKNAKEAETVNLGIALDFAKHAANQVSQILWGGKNISRNVDVNLYTDNHATLEIIASTRQAFAQK